MKKKLFSWLAMFCFIIPCMFGLSACGKEPPAMTGYKIIVNQQLIAESRTINVTYGDEIEWSAIALYDDSTTSSLPVTDITVTDEDEVVGTKPTVGSYEVKFKYLEYGEYTVTVNVTPKSLEIPTARNLVYNGEAQTTELTGYDEETMTLSGDLTATNASTYAVEVALKDTTNYCWSDGTTASQTVEYLVAKAKIAKPTKVETTYTYTGSPITLQLEGYLEGSMSITGNVETNAGTYTAVVTLEDTANYEWKNAASSEIEWEIEKAQGTAPTSAPAALSGTYAPDKTLADYTVASGYEWVDDTIVPTVAVSEYDVIYNPNPTNYTDYEMKYTLNIARAQIAVPTVTGGAITFNETEQTVELANFDAAKMSVEGNSEVEVGEHTAVVTITDGNYAFVGGETTANIAWSIGKGTPTLTIPYDYSKQFDGTTINLPRCTMPAVLQAEIAEFDVVYRNAKGEEVEYANVTAPGAYTMTVSTVETDHYYAKSVTQEFQIYYYLPSEYSAETIKVEVADRYNMKYDGTAKTPAVTINKIEYDEDGRTVLSTTPLVLGVDYTLEYRDNVEYYSRAKIIITGIGAYKGEIIETFTIAAESIFESASVNGNTIDLSSTETVTTTSNPAGHTVVLTLSDLYEDALDYGYFEFYAYDKFDKTVCTPTVIEDTLTFIVPNETRMIRVEYRCMSSYGQYIYLKMSDVLVNNDYVSISSGLDCHVQGENILEIASNADDTTSKARQIITAIFADTNNYTMQGDWNYVAGSLNIADDEMSFTIQVTDNNSTITLSYDIVDNRPAFYKSYVNFEYIKLQNDEADGYIDVPANKTFTIEKMSEMTTLDLYLNDMGNIDKLEILFDGTVKYTKLSGRDNYQGFSNIRFEMVVEGEFGSETVIVEEAGTYTLRFYLTESTYEDWYVVVGEIVDMNYVTIVYDGETYQLTETFDGGILAKYDLVNETVDYLYVYVGEIAELQTTVTLSLSSSVTKFYDESQQVIADTSNLELTVITPAQGARYVRVYVNMGELGMIPLYLYFCDAPADITFNFANVSLDFNFEYDTVDNDGTTEYHFGDFVATEITPDDQGVIYLTLNLTKEQLGLMTQPIVDAELYDKTVICDISLEYATAMVVYNVYQEYIASIMFGPSPEVLHIPVWQDMVAPGADQTYQIMFAIADAMNLMGGMFMVTIHIA